MTLKDELLETVEKEDADSFISFTSKYQSKSQIQDLEEALNSLSTSQLAEVWEKVHNLCTSVLLGLDENGDDETEENIQKNKQMLSVLQSTVTLATASLISDTPSIPDSLFDTAVIIEGVLLSLPVSADKLKNSMAKLFETWWTKELHGREELGIHTFTYVLERSLEVNSPVADVKRVWAMRMAVKLVDLFNPNFEHIRGLLLYSFMHMSYLKSEEGRRFLSFLFSLGPNLIELLHQAIKNQLPVVPRSLLEFYGEVYFRAWQVASGDCLQKMETYCIQDLMHHAVHGSRQTSRSLAHVLRKVLGYIHYQKPRRGVDEMLLRLYEPILWRSLKVASGAVRANAASLLVDAFPLQNPEANVEETDSLLQKQFDLFQSLMYDPCVEVRTVTIAGVCRIINVYWEFIPNPVLRTMISSLYEDLVYDVSSADVRVAVIKGQLELLDNHLCHPLLKPILPTLKDFFHDISEKVRLSMLELLIKVRGIRGISFLSIVPMEDLLARLETDTPPVARRIMKLIFSAYVPRGKGPDEQLHRCLTLIRSNPGAARTFYQYADKHMTLEEAVEYIILLCRCALFCVRREQKKSASTSQASSENSDGEGEEEKEESDKENVESDPELSVHSKAMAGLLEAMAVLWTSVSPQLGKVENEELRHGLRRKFAIAFPEFLNTFQERHAYEALVALSGLMPPQLVPHISRGCLSRLKDMTDDSESEDYWILLEAMCNWGKMAELLELISDWLEDGLKIPDPCESSRKSKSKKKGKKTVAFTDPRTPQPMLAIKYLSSLMSHPRCQKLLLLNYKQELQELSTLLSSVTKCLERRVVSPSALGQRTTDDFLTRVFIMYQKLEILLHSSDNPDNNASVCMEQLYSWADHVLLSTLTQREHDICSVSRKRKMNEAAGACRMLATDLVKSLLQTGRDMLLVGVGDMDFASHFTDFVSLSLQTDECVELVPLAGQALYQLIQQWRVCEAETCPHSSLVPTLYSKLLQTLASCINRDDQSLTEQEQDKVDKLLSSIKSTMTEVLQAVYRCQQLDSKLVSDIMASTMASVIADFKHHSKLGKLDQDELCESLSEFPPLSAFFLNIIFKKNYMAASFCEELYECIKCGAVEGLNGLNGVVYLTANLHHNKPSLSIPGLKDCLVSLQVQAEKLQEEMIDYDTNSPDRMVLTGLMTRLRQTQDGLVSV